MYVILETTSISTNFFLSFATVWSLTYFFTYLYIFLTFSIIIYIISNMKDFTNFNQFSNLTFFNYLTGFDLIWFFLTPLFLTILINYSWTSPLISIWFGHLIFSSLQFKVTYLLSFIFILVWVAYSSSFYYSSQEVYDYTIVTYSFLYWLILLFYSNNIFTVIFFIEILSTLINLLLITSVFSSTYFYNNLSLSSHSYFSQSTPFSFLQTLLFFFWISLVGSLNLFIFLVLFYVKFLTFDWYTLEAVFYYIVSISDLKSIFFTSLVWFNFMFCIFLKCGLVPFYFWKPVFFKGIPAHALFFYIFFFYFSIFLFFIYFLIVYLSDIFYFNLIINLILIVLGIFFLMFILCESYYIKAFLAMSSILNTLLIFLAMSSFCIADFTFIL